MRCAQPRYLLLQVASSERISGVPRTVKCIGQIVQRRVENGAACNKTDGEEARTETRESHPCLVCVICIRAYGEVEQAEIGKTACAPSRIGLAL